MRPNGRRPRQNVDPIPSKALRYIGYVGVLGEFEFGGERASAFLDEMETAKQIAEQLYKQDPHSAEKRRMAAVLNFRIAQWHSNLGTVDKAKAAFDRSLELRRVAVDLDPSNDRKQLDLFIASAGSGDELTCESLYQRYSVFPKIDNEMRIDLARGCARLAASAAEPQKWQTSSLNLIRVAIDEGFCDPVLLQTELDFDTVRGTEDFNSLLNSATKPLEP